MPKMPVYLKIFVGMIAGILLGIAALCFGGEFIVADWIAPFGKLFIRLLQLVAVPLVFFSLVKGVVGLNDIGKFSRMGGETILVYIVTTVFAVVIGLAVGLAVKPGASVDRTKIADIRENYRLEAEKKKNEAEQSAGQGPLNFLTEIVPNNIVGAASDNSKMLQVIFFAVFFGVAALTISPDRARPVVSLFDGLNDIILRMVDYIIRLAPLGVMALMAGLVVDFKGDAGIFASLGVYALTVVGAMLLFLLAIYPLAARIFAKIKLRDFFKAMYPVQIFAFTTSSSAATLPVTMDAVENKLKVSKETASFVLPVGVTVNMDGTSCYQTIAVIFIAQVLGIELGLQQLLVIVGMTVLSSIGTPGIPGGSYVILAMVLTSVGIPAEGLAIILGIDRPLDMLRTSVNVTGDATVAGIIDKIVIR
ncbi:MAG: dicarboxylate/amino acid:cation symporter [Prevotellaceae bacterium]|nr:dicarboxylate/amino acid:cation symporter [Prevotellaceae bacterium]